MAVDSIIPGPGIDGGGTGDVTIAFDPPPNVALTGAPTSPNITGAIPATAGLTRIANLAYVNAVAAAGGGSIDLGNLLTPMIVRTPGGTTVLQLNSDGSGQVGPFTWDSANNITGPPELVSVMGLSITTTALDSGVIDRPFQQTLEATGGLPPYSWSLVNLPPGLSYNSASGEISGAPTGIGSFIVDITVTDSSLARRIVRHAKITMSVGTRRLRKRS
jgi:hypothetical protein